MGAQEHKLAKVIYLLLRIALQTTQMVAEWFSLFSPAVWLVTTPLVVSRSATLTPRLRVRLPPKPLPRLPWHDSPFLHWWWRHGTLSPQTNQTPVPAEPCLISRTTSHRPAPLNSLAS